MSVPALSLPRHPCWVFFSWAAATTQRENGVPFSPFTCLWLIPLQAWRCGVTESSVAAFAIAVTHWLNGVPGWPATCFLLQPWQ